MLDSQIKTKQKVVGKILLITRNVWKQKVKNMHHANISKEISRLCVHIIGLRNGMTSWKMVHFQDEYEQLWPVKQISTFFSHSKSTNL